MLPSLKSEFRKLLSVRSTYVIVIITLLIVALFAGFGDGFKATSASLQRPTLLMSESTNAIVFVGLILAFAGLLLLGHEYRYNTIMYTLTSSPSRLRSLAAKVAAVSVFAAVTSLLVAFFAPLCTIVGAHLHGHHIGLQSFDYWSVIWRCVFVGWGYAMYAFILIAILRNQVGAIVTFLLVPLIGETIIGHIFTHSNKYLPFSSLQAVVQQGGDKMGTSLSAGHSALVALAYIAVGLAASALLFIRRDAN
jgi:ABC-2 type transport system permease protein